MARKASTTLTEAELRVMKVLWKRGPSTVQDVLDALPSDDTPAYSTILTVLRILEQKEYVRHKKRGRAFVYHALVDQSAARQSVLRYVVDRFFNNSPELVVLNLLKSEDMDLDDLERLKAQINGVDPDPSE